MRPPASPWTAACGMLIGATLLAVTVPARAGDDDVPLDTKILRSIMGGIGLVDPNKAPIDYHERPPLVIPPDNALPPPETGDAVTKNPNWPKDPDIARAREAQRMEANRGNSTEQIEREMNPLRPEEITPGHNPRTPPRGGKISVPNGADGSILSPSELGYNGGLFGLFKGGAEKPVRFTGEPTRSSLIEPPPGYQTPSPDQPYGQGKGPPPKADNYSETHGTMQNDR